MSGAPNDVTVVSSGNVLIHSLPSSNPAGTTDTVALPMQGVAGGVPIQTAQPGSNSIATVQASVGTAAVLLVPARAGPVGTGRILVMILNPGPAPAYIGNSNVTAANGYEVPPGSVSIATTAAIYAILPAGATAQVLTALETY